MRNMNFFYDLTAKYAASSKPYKRQLEYLQSTGTQYIDTGIYFDPAQNMQATVRAAAINTARSIILSSYPGATGISAFGLEWGGTSNGHALTPRTYIQLPTILDFWDGAQTLYDPVDIDVLYQYASDVKSVTMSVGGVAYTMSSTAALGGQSSYSILLFSDRRPNPSVIANGNRIYSVALKKNGALVCDMIPVLDWNDVPCMYDKVSKQLFYNQGTGQFLYPMTDDDSFTLDITLTSDNLQFGVIPYWNTGGYCNVEWGDGTAVTVNKNLDVFTSGTKVSHTFATPGTYHIKLATAPCTIVFDPYDSDNGNYAALGQ